MLKGSLIRIAIIDDDEDDFFIITDYIKAIEGANFVVEWINDFSTAIDKVKAKSYNLYFVDYRLGNQTGVEFLEQASAIGCDDPIVLLTGKGNRSIDIKAMQSGATDYLVKSELNTEKLERCIRYSLDRAAALKELKTREHKYRMLFEGSKDAVFITDKNLSFIEANNASSELFGINKEALIGRHLFEFMKDESQKKEITSVLEKKETVSDLEIQIHGKEVKYCLLTVSFQKDGHEKQESIHGIIHDITNIKKTELANLQAQKLAANERLMRILAHEIRNPLNNISLSVEHLMLPEENEADYAEKQKQIADIIKRNSIRINKIITELLNLTRPPELVFEDYSLQEIVDLSIDMTTDRIQLQKVKVQKKYPDSPLVIQADKHKLIIAFTNILINAIEAMEANKGELKVSIEEQPAAYSVCIRDNGAGIPTEYISKLFEPFFTSKKNGTGLGLAASYSIIQSHKGVIQVESTVDEGSIFTISFNK